MSYFLSTLQWKVISPCLRGTSALGRSILRSTHEGLPVTQKSYFVSHWKRNAPMLHNTSTQLLVKKSNLLASDWIPITASTCLHTSHINSASEKSLALLHVLKEIKASPAPALIFGLAGLIPFVSAPAYILSGDVFLPDVAFAQLAYGVSILSFLGGVRWGFALPANNCQEMTWKNLGLSVLPSLLAWAALLMPYTCGVLTVMGSLGGAAYMDLKYQSYPTWFKALRFCLSLIAVLSLYASFILSFIYDVPSA